MDSRPRIFFHKMFHSVCTILIYVITPSLFDTEIIVFLMPRHSNVFTVPGICSDYYQHSSSRLVPSSLSSLLGSIFRSWINPARRLCRQKSDSRLVGAALAKRRLRIRNCFRLARVPRIEPTNPRQFLNGCQSFPVLGLVARRKVSELVVRA